MAINKGHVLILASALTTTAPAHDLASPEVCRSLGQQATIVGPRDAVNNRPRDVSLRLRLANAWSDAGCFNEAVQVLQEGQSFDPNNRELDARLKMARSNVTEQSYFEHLDQAEAAAKLSRDRLRCSKLADLEACSAALSLAPNDPDLLGAQADALVQLKRPAEAIPIYRRIIGSTHNDTVAARLTAAESQRLTFLGQCQTLSGEPGLQACQSAWLAGAADGFTVNRRRGILLQEQNEPARAFDAYIAAERQHSGDPAVAQAIVSLAKSTGRRDALALAARGSALLTLGRAREALEPLREAMSLEPDLSDARPLLNRATAQLKNADRQDLLTADPARPSTDKPEPRFSNQLPAGRSN